MLVKIVILTLFAAVIISMGYSLMSLGSRRADSSDRLLSGLKLRVALSVTLFVVLMVAYGMGWITPNGG